MCVDDVIVGAYGRRRWDADRLVNFFTSSLVYVYFLSEHRLL